MHNENSENENYSYGGVICNSLFEDSYRGDESYEHIDVLEANNVPASDFKKVFPKDKSIEAAYSFLKI